MELRQRLAVYCDARLRLLDEPQHRRTRGLDDRCDLCRLTATPNHELGGSVDAPRCAGEHPRKAAGQIWGQKRDLNPSAAAVGQEFGKSKGFPGYGLAQDRFLDGRREIRFFS